MSEPRLSEAPHNVWLRRARAQRPNKKTKFASFEAISLARQTQSKRRSPLVLRIGQGAYVQSGSSPLHDVRYRVPSLAQARELFDASCKAASKPDVSTRSDERGDQNAQRRIRVDDPTADGSGATKVVEPDGIEPTTSCLQSTRSPN